MPKRKRPNREPDLRPRREIQAGRHQRGGASEGPSLEALAGVMIALPIGYLAIEGIMNDNRHPIHWLVTLIAGAIGYWGGQGIYWLKQR